jgi:hypothetical protein
MHVMHVMVKAHVIGRILNPYISYLILWIKVSFYPDVTDVKSVSLAARSDGLVDNLIRVAPTRARAALSSQDFSESGKIQ